MLRTWVEPNKISIPDTFTHFIGGHPLVSQVLYERGIRDPESARGFLDPEYYQPASSLELPGMDKMVKILQKAITGKKKIGVWGDFDVDGQTATTVLVSVLRELGGNVIYHIPVRSTESHGISVPSLEKFLNTGVDLILTCDTGISSHEAIEFARDKGIPSLITDHHDLPDELPRADVIVNPKMLSSDHPLRTLPGVGVAYKLAELLVNMDGELDCAARYLDLVALGIVADIASLKGDTRYLLQRGIKILQSTKRLGLSLIMELAELNPVNLSEEHISFVLAPRLNAIGRLDDANIIVELLTTTDIGRARVLALKLESLNANRKLLTDQVYLAAEAQLLKDRKLLDSPILVLSHPSWPAGVIGIVAARLVEKYHRPVILFSTPAGKEARGSARSIEGVNITSAIAANRDLVNGFGGHPMAAGLAIDSENIIGFREAISNTIQEIGVDIQKEISLQIDGYLTLPELSLELVEDLERLAPFGAGNPSLILATEKLRLTGYAVVGRNDEHLQLTIEDELGHTQRSIWWQGAGFSLPEGQFDLAYSVRASTYRGQREVQIEWVHYREHERLAIRADTRKSVIEVIDFRDHIDPLNILKQILAKGSLIIWGESYPLTEISVHDRFSLHPADNLAIWTIPPSLTEMQVNLQKVKPHTVYLFGINPGMDHLEAFLKRLLGLLKYQISHNGGYTDFSSLAAATAQRISTVKLGLDWLISHGHISLISSDDDHIQVNAGTKIKAADTHTISTLLNAALNESSAFRRYYLKTNKDRLVFLE